MILFDTAKDVIHPIVFFCLVGTASSSLYPAIRVDCGGLATRSVGVATERLVLATFGNLATY